MALTAMRWLLFLAVASTAALGAPAISPPACAWTCIDSTTNNIPRGGCTARNTACLCGSGTYSLEVNQCIEDTCRDLANRTLGLNYFADICAEAIAEAVATRTTTTTLFITSTPPLVTNTSTRPTSSTPTTPLPGLTSPSSLDSLQTTTSTLTPTFFFATTESPSPGTDQSSNAPAETSIDQGNIRQRNAIIGCVVGVAALLAIIVIILLYRRRKNKKAEDESGRHLQFVGEEVGSPSVAVHPWRTTRFSFTSFAHPNASGYPANGHGVTEELPKYEGPRSILPEKYASPRGGSVMSTIPAPPPHPLARPRQSGPWHQQDLSHLANE